MSIEVEDALAKQREAKEKAKQFTEALTNGNQALVECFQALAEYAREAAEEGNLTEVEDALRCIDTLGSIGYGADE